MLEEWQPRQFFSSMAEMDADQFLATFARTCFLLVDIEGAPDRLVSALFHSSPLVRHDTPLIEELTGATDMGSGRRDRGRLGTRSTQAASLAMDILADPAMSSRFLAPLTRRLGGASQGAVSIGRHLGNDVILKHQSVSRVHATFERLADGTLRLTDLDSKNGTWINGERLSGTRTISNGDTLKLGQVEAVLCDADVLWQIVHPEVSTLTSTWRGKPRY